MLTSRRSFLGLLAAPAIVRASSLMKVVPLPERLIISEIGGRTTEYVDPLNQMLITGAKDAGHTYFGFHEEVPNVQFLVPCQYAEKIALS